nr:hypothetical protein [Tanacetum cinerariifolium]
ARFCSSPEYPEYLSSADDEIVAEDQPYADYALPVALSPGYVADSDPKEDPEEDSKDSLVDYPADRADLVIAPIVDLVPSSEETEPFETNESATTPPPPTDGTTPLGARISIQPQAPMPFLLEAKAKRLLSLPRPPLSPLISLLPPFVEERLARDVWVDPIEAVEEIPPTNLEGVNARVTELVEVHEEDTQDIYVVIKDTQDRQTRLSHRVDVLIEDREFHQETVLLMKREDLVLKKAWAQSVGLSMAVHQEL